MYHYRECGLSNIWLANGFAWVSTPLGKGLRIENPDGLQKAIAETLAGKPGPLSGGEFRFLRKRLDLSQRSLAAMLGNDAQTIALWEKGRGAPRWADCLIRALHWEERGSSFLLKDIFGDDRPAQAKSPARLVFDKRPRGDWHQVSSTLAKAA